MEIIIPFIPPTIEILGTQIELLKLLISILIFVVGLVIASIVRVTVTRFIGKYIPDTTESVIKKFVYWGIIAVAALSALGNMDVDLTGVLVAGGVAGIIIGFATQSIVANLISGLFLHLDRPVKIGDSVGVIGPDIDVEGVIVEITAFSTRLRKFDGVFVRIPNEKFFTAQLKNFQGYSARRVEVMIGIAYKEDAATAMQLIQNMIANEPRILVEPAPNVMVWELADSSVNLRVWVWVPSVEWLEIREEILQRIKELLDKSGIEIPFPQRTVWLAQTETRGKETLMFTKKPIGLERDATGEESSPESGS